MNTFPDHPTHKETVDSNLCSATRTVGGPLGCGDQKRKGTDMGLWTGVVDVGLDSERAVLIDSCSMRPLNLPLFDSVEQLDGFLLFAKSNGFDDVRRTDDTTLNNLHTQWIRAGAPEARDPDDGEESYAEDSCGAEGRA